MNIPLVLPKWLTSRRLPRLSRNLDRSDAPQPSSVENQELETRPNSTQLDLTRPNSTVPAPAAQLDRRKYFIASQIAWLDDVSPLRIIEKSRQVGISYVDAYDSVIKASEDGAKYDVWVSSRDETQAKLYLEDCKYWAEIFHIAATDYGEVVFDKKNKFSALVLEFKNGRRIYCLSSNPDALAGKRGHVKLDEFALHQDQRKLFTVAKPVTMWGGQLSIISTHRGRNTLFNEIIEDIKNGRNRMGWNLHSVPLQKAVDEGLVERINERTGRDETREGFVKRLHDECIDEDSWNQEYCCKPSDENSAFFTHETITGCEDQTLRLMSLMELINYMQAHPDSVFYLGMDIGRHIDLCVIDVGEQIGDVIWDRCRIELQDRPYGEMKSNLYPILSQPNLQRACLDGRGIGDQLGEEARYEFGWKVEPIQITAAIKEQLAIGLRRDFEDRRLRMVRDDKLRADLHSLRKLVTPSGNIRYDGQADDSHCDRTWAKALRQNAARFTPSCGGAVA